MENILKNYGYHVDMNKRVQPLLKKPLKYRNKISLCTTVFNSINNTNKK